MDRHRCDKSHSWLPGNGTSIAHVMSSRLSLLKPEFRVLKVETSPVCMRWYSCPTPLNKIAIEARCFPHLERTLQWLSAFFAITKLVPSRFRIQE